MGDASKIHPRREVITDSEGRVVGEIVEDGGAFLVLKKEKLQFPPRNRNVLLGSCESLDDARALARKLRPDGT